MKLHIATPSFVVGDLAYDAHPGAPVPPLGPVTRPADLVRRRQLYRQRRRAQLCPRCTAAVRDGYTHCADCRRDMCERARP